MDEINDSAQEIHEEETVDYGQSMAGFRPGDTVRGRVVQVNPDSVLVDVGYKSEGVIPLRELSFRKLASAHDAVSEGQDIEMVVLKLDGEDGTLQLSKRLAEENRAWEALRTTFENGEVLEVPVVEAVKGGLVADVGMRGFIPASQVDRGFANDLSGYVGQMVRVKVIELDPEKRRVILSRKQVIEEERNRLREETWAHLAEGAVLDGVVKSLTDFGAFIDLGGVDGLLHVSEIAWGRVNHPSEVLSPGDPVRVKVLRLDPERGRISLGRKQVLPNPWDDVQERYPAGSVVEGRVVRIAAFGAFVELEPGIDGLVHISQLSDQHVTRPGDAVEVGQPVRARVLRVDPVERRVSLSLRDVAQDEGVTIADRLGDLHQRFGE